MNRREFITLLGAAAATWPLPARAQQAMLGYLSPGSSDSFAENVAVLRQVLAEAGYVEGRDVAIEYRWSGDQLVS
jgi:putative tryptophan/tyrosine transport system substrate-binding protein